jgi:SNF2 family DNA or RNA helicase
MRQLANIKKARKEGLNGFQLTMSLAKLFQSASGDYDGIANYVHTLPSKTSNDYPSKKVKGIQQYAIGQPISMVPRFSRTVFIPWIENAEIEATKLKYLESDLLSLREKEPAFHAVVFTHISTMVARVTAIGKKAGIAVYQCRAGLSMKERHENLRGFQEMDDRPKLFVVTVSSGNCGINVQSATRVYLMEPSIDPATEIQVAGRIHRLGQLNDVLVRRLCFRDSIEEKVCSLHDKIKNGDAKVTPPFPPCPFSCHFMLYFYAAFGRRPI